MVQTKERVGNIEQIISIIQRTQQKSAQSISQRQLHFAVLFLLLAIVRAQSRAGQKTGGGACKQNENEKLHKCSKLDFAFVSGWEIKYWTNKSSAYHCAIKQIVYKQNHEVWFCARQHGRYDIIVSILSHSLSIILNTTRHIHAGIESLEQYSCDPSHLFHA